MEKNKNESNANVEFGNERIQNNSRRKTEFAEEATFKRDINMKNRNKNFNMRNQNKDSKNTNFDTDEVDNLQI